MATWLFVSMWGLWIIGLLLFSFSIIAAMQIDQHNRSFKNTRSYDTQRLSGFGVFTLIGFPIITLFWLSWNIFG
jgi:predicted outer membrane lipoprotein